MKKRIAAIMLLMLMLLAGCGEDTPRSKSIPFTRSMPRSSRIFPSERKFPWTNVMRSAHGARRAFDRSMAVSS